MSSSDKLQDAQAKMKEYQENGVKLGWLIAPQLQQVEIYSQDGSMEVVDKPSVLSGADLLPNLAIELDFIWE